MLMHSIDGQGNFAIKQYRLTKRKMNLTNNTILITGGTSGIGLTLGEALLKRGNTVIVLGRNKPQLLEANKKGFEVIQCDLTDQGEIENATLHIQRHYPSINMLFNNAGVQYNYNITESVIPLEKISKEVAINVTGQMILTQLLIPLLCNAEKSFIINTTSGLGAFPKTNGVIYSATKAAMRNYTTGLRLALQSTPISVLELIPPVTETKMTKGRDGKKMPVEEFVATILPQLEKERKIITVPKMRLFLYLAFLFPGLAHKILSKQ
ncbi:MAG: SDR family NAD(P)-dependent oxidoreductase [Cyclobacteriaceae bacterium]